MKILNDFNTSVERALSEIDSHYKDLEGLIICGTHSPDPEKIVSMLQAIKEARENNIPTLGICFGIQLMAIEYAKNVWGVRDATSEEFGEGTFIVKKLPELRVGLHGKESWWNNYAIDRQYLTGFKVKYIDDIVAEIRDGNRIGVQYHPEYQSSMNQAHPILIEFIHRCRTL